MPNTLVQFRADPATKREAIIICLKLGIDLQSYLRMCLSRLVQEKGIPFPMNLEDAPESKAVKAMKTASKIAAENGFADMTLEEINAEIAESRR